MRHWYMFASSKHAPCCQELFEMLRRDEGIESIEARIRRSLAAHVKHTWIKGYCWAEFTY